MCCFVFTYTCKYLHILSRKALHEVIQGVKHLMRAKYCNALYCWCTTQIHKAKVSALWSYTYIHLCSPFPNSDAFHWSLNIDICRTLYYTLYNALCTAWWRGSNVEAKHMVTEILKLRSHQTVYLKIITSPLHSYTAYLLFTSFIIYSFTVS